MEIRRINCDHKLVVAVVKKGSATKVVQAMKGVGAEGATILFGRGTAEDCGYLKFLQVDDCDKKEIILSLVRQSIVDNVLATITQVGKLNKQGTGIAFVLDTKCIAGICHLLTTRKKEEDLNV
jgi:nitrogen regulatory protein P-II 1